METINKKLSESQRVFFNNICNCTDKTMYFYGSIMRPDYISEKSDIDVDIFTDNMPSTIHKLCQLLDIEKTKFNPFILKIDNKIVRGFKARYVNKEININTELSLYDEKYKDLVLHDHSSLFVLPLHISIALCIVKFFYYYVGCIPNQTYRRIKRFLMNANDETKFVLLYS
jgi:predicted nucleotidyltransferase